MDRLLDDILRALDDLKDGTAFERWVPELLRPEWPNLVPVEGGQDAGMDGAASRDGQEVILVATVSRGSRVIANVTRSLNSHARHGREKCGILVATPAVLSARQCRNILDRIRQLGYRPAHPHPYTREALAQRLYDTPRIRRGLLGLTGKPPCLSRFPYRSRPLCDLPLIGRSDDLEWLRTTDGDRLLSGQPGIGKSFLLTKYAEEVGATFVRNAEDDEIADAIREQRPRYLIVEDAHVRRDLLDRVIQLRTDLDAEFVIVVDTWPNRKTELMVPLSLVEAQCREIRRLKGPEIVELIKKAGVFGPDSLLHQLVHQADGCPGRAAMLVEICRRESVIEAWDGRALTRWTRDTFCSEVGPQAFRFLGVISLAGKSGLSVSRVSTLVGAGASEVREACATLAYGGVVEELEPDHVRVMPDALRCNLAKEVFFDSTPRMPLDPALAAVPHLGHAAHTLIGAYARGASLTSYDLLNLVEQANDDDAWEYFASVDPTHTSILLDRHPDRVKRLFKPMLHCRPDLMIRRGLELSVGDERPLNSHPDHPLRRLADWADEAAIGPGDFTANRTLLLDEAIGWLKDGKDLKAGLEAARIAMATSIDCESTPPGEPRTCIIRFDYMPVATITAIDDRWPRLLSVLRSRELKAWGPVQAIIHDWVHPYAGGGATATDEQMGAFHRLAGRMVQDLAEMCAGRPGVMSELAALGESVGVDLLDRLDPDFMAMFPHEHFRDDISMEEEHRSWDEGADALVTRLLSRSPADGAQLIGRCLDEREFAECGWPDLSSYVCSKLAGAVDCPGDWLAALLEQNVASEHIGPFLGRLQDEKVDAWGNALHRCLAERRTCFVAVVAILNDPDHEDVRVCEAIAVADRQKLSLEYALDWANLPEARLLRLLEHPSEHLATAAALV